MLCDMEGNRICLNMKINRHIKVLGMSGNGKSFWAWQLIKELSDTMPVLICDYSGSYTTRELEKHAGSGKKEIKQYDFKQETVRIYVDRNKSNTIEILTDVLIHTIGIDAVSQRDILEEAIKLLLNTREYLSLKDIVNSLSCMRQQEEDSEYVRNISYLQRRLNHMRNVSNIQFGVGMSELSEKIYILQLSDWSKRVRETLTQILLELLWTSVKRDGTKDIQLVLDEFQNIKIKETAVEEMLREGRRFGLGLIMLSQFNPRKDEVDILEQASSSLYFRPNEKNISDTARMIAWNQYKEWIPILSKLKKGECILCGDYRVNDKEVQSQKPLLCEVCAEQV